MKKLLSFLFAVLLLLPCLSFTAGAYGIEDWGIPLQLPYNATITFSEDLKTLYVGELPYSRFNASNANLSAYYSLENAKLFDDETVEDIELSANQQGNVIEAWIYYRDGSQLHCWFMDNRYLEEYEQIINGANDELYINFYLEEDPYLRVEAKKLKSKKIHTREFNFYSSEIFDVSAFVWDKSIEVNAGRLLVWSDKVYYEAEGDNEENKGYAGETWTFYQIEDPQLLQEIRNKQREYYDESDYGVLLDQEIAKRISVVFFAAFFIVFPFAVMIGGIILAIRSKKRIYKKMFIITAVLAAIEAVLFLVGGLLLF